MRELRLRGRPADNGPPRAFYLHNGPRERSARLNPRDISEQQAVTTAARIIGKDTPEVRDLWRVGKDGEQ